MRLDTTGMFWDDYFEEMPARSTQAHRVVLRPVPETGWLPPKDLPNLSGEKILSFDVETKDPNLTTRGPGGVRGDGHLVGVSVATEDRSWYFPMRHEFESQKGLNKNPEQILSWAKDLFGTPRLYLGANILYDLEWLRAEGVHVARGSQFFDVQYAEPLIDENRYTYSLESLAHRYADEGKDSGLLYKWCAESFGGKADETQRANIWRAPPSLVGPYAESDARLPLLIMNEQRKILEAEHLTTVCDLEQGLIPLLLDMRFRGVRVDTDKAEQVAKWLRAEAAKAQLRLGSVDVWSNVSLAHAFDEAGIEYGRTAQGNPSFTKLWLETQEHPLAKDVLDVRLYEKAVNPFVESYILGNVHNGRIHCQFHPLRSDQYGAVSGRFSSSNPNLQNIPARHPIIAPMLRSMFIPEIGARWRREDYSQIEFRLLVSDAVGRGAEELRERYRANPKTDFHQMTIDMVHEIVGVLLDRKPAKNINFGLVYGMGKNKTVSMLGSQGDKLYDAYFEALPSVKKTYQSAMRLADRRGYIKTILGRRRRFDRIEEGVRVGTHAALNARLQGGAADVIKKAMLTIYEVGIYDIVGTPHLTVHDELDGSDDGTPEVAQAYAEAKHIMETCVPIKVPMLVDETLGDNWGECA